MATCNKCNVQVYDGAVFCPQCGSKVNETDKIFSRNGVSVNLSELISRHGSDRISAIKELRQLTNIDLSTAKGVIDELYRGSSFVPAPQHKKSIFKRWWFWVVVAIVFIAVLANLGDDRNKTITNNSTPTNNSIATSSVEPKESSTAPASVTKKEKFEVIEHEMTQDEYYRHIVGKIKNNSGKELSYVQIEITLYDKDGVQVGSALANMNNFEIDSTWKFDAIVLEDEAVSYKIKDVTGF